MSAPRRTALAVVTLLALAARAAADPAPSAPPPGNGFWHLSAPWHLTTDSGATYDLPPAYVLDEPTWAVRDAEVKRLQTAETRLQAENQSLRNSTAGWQPGWETLAATLLTGLAAGWYLERKL